MALFGERNPATRPLAPRACADVTRPRKVPHRTRLALRLHGDLVAPCLVSPQDLSVGLLDGDDAIVETRLPGGSDNLPAYLYPALLGEIEPGIGGKRRPGGSSEG